MSSRLIEPPNYTQVPNVILDEWMSILTPAEFKVIICICRKTFGWHKQIDTLSLNQIEKMTGLSRKGLIQNLQSLLQKELIKKIKSKTEYGDDSANQYLINVNCMGVGSELSTPGVVNLVHQGGSELSTPTKERPLTKERLTKDELLRSSTHSPQKVVRGIASPKISFSFDLKKFENISLEELEEWKKAYPAISSEAELLRMAQWCLSNSSKAKAKSNWRKFITNWLSRAQDQSINTQARLSQVQMSRDSNNKFIEGLNRRPLDSSGNPIQTPYDNLF